MKIFVPLYHVTPDRNIENISFEGIDPTYSEGARALSWYTDERSLVWACLKVASKRKISPGQMVICTVNIPEDLIKRTCWQGVFTCNSPMLPTNYMSVEAALADYESWLAAVAHEANRVNS